MKKLNLKALISSILILSSQLYLTTCTYANTNLENKESFISNSNNASNIQRKLIWSDEFDETDINLKNWTYDIGIGNNGWGNNELQYYTNNSNNARIEDGNLVIEARKENYQDRNYTSARLKSKNLKEFTYGRIEARIKLPFEQGIWPAFWMLGSNFNGDADWPYCGEIDIMEHVNMEKRIFGSLHYYNNTPHTFGSNISLDNVEDYHVYAIEWTPSTIKWYVDDTLYNEAVIGPVNISENSSFTPSDMIQANDAFNKPFFLLLNVAVGGNWPKDPDSTTIFPAKMYVDYVRVYE